MPLLLFLTAIPVDCRITFLRFPLPHPIHNSSNYIWLLSAYHSRSNADSEYKRCEPQPHHLISHAYRRRDPDATNSTKDKPSSSLSCVVVVVIHPNHKHRDHRHVGGGGVWRCLELTMQLLLLPRWLRYVTRAWLLSRYFVGALVWRLKRTIND